MRHEYFPSIPDRRFQKRADFAITVTHRNADQMSPDSATNMDEPVVPAEEWVRPRAADYLWRPWYAKLWWAAIPIYWLPAGSPFGIDFLADFYGSSVGIYLNIVFLPITALLVLGFGYARKWRDSEHWVDISEGEHNSSSLFYRRTPYSPPAYADPLSPLYQAIHHESAESRARRQGH
ncbi:hypothetical protein [Sphingobium sp. KCTC 72723]|uniref:hypothetical protein n=1 Tax=Sphingobium sp. KCTC 72723 TaxID=2733867 RepID=UPI00165E7775|nr:hypothetical protein [Sphingobium sp. KCTC 72723]